MDRRPLDLRGLVLNLVDESQSSLTKHTIQYSGVDEPLLILGDGMRVEQVVQNLIQNAVKYSLKGGVIDVCLEREDGNAVLSVTDSGIGVPASALPNLFGRFYRAENAEKMHVGGMGIGLYVVKEIVTLHGGTVEVKSEEGKGSTFTVRLPLMQ